MPSLFQHDEIISSSHLVLILPKRSKQVFKALVPSFVYLLTLLCNILLMRGYLPKDG